MRPIRIEMLSLILLFVSLVTSTQTSPSNEKRVVCYYTNWSIYRPGTTMFSPEDIDPYLCTHLIYAFSGLSEDNIIKSSDENQDIVNGGYTKFTALKSYNKNLKTLLAIGGWNEASSRFSPMVASVERRCEFVNNTIKFLRQNHFDGLDLDWQHPADRGGKPQDKENYALLVQELREEFDRESEKTGRPRLLLTMPIPTDMQYIQKGYDIPKLNKYLDWFSLLAYDYHNGFEPMVNHHAPLYVPDEPSEYDFDPKLNINYSVKYYLSKGIDPSKLLLGIPTFGRSFNLNTEVTRIGAPADGPGAQGEGTREKGALAYFEICQAIQNDDGWTVVQQNTKAFGPYAFKENLWVSYDDETMARKKAEYVVANGLGGIMFWSLDQDDFRGTCHGRPYPIIQAAKEAMLGLIDYHSIMSNQGTEKICHYPTTPDPDSDFKCENVGFYPYPGDVQKYYWCMDSGPTNLGVVAHLFTCPSGLVFNDKISQKPSTTTQMGALKHC